MRLCPSQPLSVTSHRHDPYLPLPGRSQPIRGVACPWGASPGQSGCLCLCARVALPARKTIATDSLTLTLAGDNWVVCGDKEPAAVPLFTLMRHVLSTVTSSYRLLSLASERSLCLSLGHGSKADLSPSISPR